MTIPRTALRELGKRLHDRREEARLDIATLGEQAHVPVHMIDAFEAGHGGLGVAELMRIAKVLGVPPTSFIHTRAPIVPAPVEPSVVLKAPGAAWLNEPDRDVLAGALRRARAFTEVGELLGVERLASGFTASLPPADRPFTHGADVAHRVRALLPERQGPLRDLARLLEGRFDILVLRHRFSDSQVLGAACRTGNARVVAVNAAAKETTRRFALAHELGHHVLDLPESGVTADEDDRDAARFWLDNPPIEKRANAFAAMLLAPKAAVADLIGPAPRDVHAPDYEEGKRLVEAVRTRVGMGFAAVAWHLHNLGYYDEGRARSLLLAEADAEPLTGFEAGDTRYDGLHRRVFAALSRDIISRARARELLGGEDLGALDLAS